MNNDKYNKESYSAPQIYGKNREKLLKIEIQMHMKDYIREKEISDEEKKKELKKLSEKESNSSTSNVYSKYEKENENKNGIMTKLIGDNILTNNILTNNLTDNVITNMFNKKKLFSWLGIPTKFDEMNNYSKWWRFYDGCITMCNFLVLLLALYDYELNFSYPRSLINDYNIVRILMILLSIAALFCVIKRHYNKLKWKNINLTEGGPTTKYKYGGKDDNDEDDFFYNEQAPTTISTSRKRKFFKKGLVLDFLINLIIPYPRLDFIFEVSEIDRDNNDYIVVQYLFSDVLYILIIVRMFYIIRSSINYSIFTDHFANTVAKEQGVKCNIRFALKCILKTHHIKAAFVFFIASNIVLGYALRVFERPFWVEKGRLEFEYLTNSCWLVFITMLTIGYGDFAPITTAGRVVVVISALWGTFICSLVVVCLYGLLDLSNDQFLVFTKIVKSRVAIKFIEDAYSLRKSRVNRKKNPQAVPDAYASLLESFNEFKNMRNESKSIYRSNGLLHYNMKLLKEMKKFNQRFDKLEIDLESLTMTPNNELIKIA